MTHLKRVELMY